MAVWSDDDEIVCVHPGGPRVVGPAAIRATFEAIFANGVIPVQPEKVRRVAERSAAPCTAWSRRVDIQTTEGTQTAMGHRHQRLPEDRAGLAPGSAPCQPGQAAELELPDNAVDAPIDDATDAMRAYRAPRVAARRPPADDLARAVRASQHWSAPSFARERWTRPTATSSMSTSQAGAAGAPGWCCSTAWRARRDSHYAQAFAWARPRGGTPVRGAALSRLLG